MTAPTTAQIDYYASLVREVGGEVQEFETMEEYRTAIDELRDQKPATDRQINLCEALIRDHLPGKALPENPSELLAANLIRHLYQKRPTLTMLQRLAEMERNAGISSGREPRDTEGLYRRQARARDMMGSDAVEQLIDAKDAQANDWAAALIDASQTATAEQVEGMTDDQEGAEQVEGESFPETEGSSVRSRRKRT